VETEYDRNKVSQSFKEAAELAGSFYRANIQNGHKDTGAALKHDELLARLTVYGHLHDRHFLQTKELLLAELRWLLKNGRPLAPRQALDAANFGRHRSKILQMLIQRFEQPGGGQSGGEQGFPRIAEG
jgi:hypothetical protein